MKGYPTYPNTRAYFEQVATLCDDLGAQTDRFIATLFRGFEEGRTIFLCGNGGSASTASHFGQDLAKGTLSSMNAKQRFRVVPLTDNIGFLTALANDEGYESIFEQQLRNLAREGDLLVAISGSGNSPNVLRALEAARGRGLATLGFSGAGGGKMRASTDLLLAAPSDRTPIIQQIHIIAAHVICALVERTLCPPPNAS